MEIIMAITLFKLIFPAVINRKTFYTQKPTLANCTFFIFIHIVILVRFIVRHLYPKKKNSY